MQQTNSITPLFFEGLTLPIVLEEDSLVILIETVLSMAGAMYVVNFQKQRFHYVSKHNLFLCGHSQEEAMQSGYDFYSRIVHTEDLTLFIKQYRAILKYICEEQDKQDEIDYFSFTFRIKGSPPMDESEYLMVYHRLKPVFVNEALCFGLCTLDYSVIRDSGNLRVYLKDNPDFYEYSFQSEKWNLQQGERLTMQEIKILRLSKQRICNKEIAAKLNISYDRLRHIKTQLFQKLNVETMEQAIIYATNHSMLF
jgi:DNA-binding CsgD family transcriptional regulator